jgi:hypothetical protein
MFQRPTVFIIGAGCSFEYKLPVGDALKTLIVERMQRLARARDNSMTVDPDMILLDAVRHIAHQEAISPDTMGPWLMAADELARGLPHSSSIDRYLHFRSDDKRIVKLGKLAIVRAILQAEQESTLHAIPLNHVSIANGAPGGIHWLGQLFLQMQEGVESKGRVADVFKNVSFISFNYDRCIEHYFYNAVKDWGSFSDHEAAEALKSLDISHPYGSVGGLPWDEMTAGTLRVKYGAEPTSEELAKLAGGIKTFAEGEHEATLVSRMHQNILHAGKIVFMGFSFLDQNVELLTPPTQTPASDIVATVYGLSVSNQNIAKLLMMAMLKGTAGAPPFPHSPQLHGTTAGNLIRDLGNELRR